MSRRQIRARRQPRLNPQQWQQRDCLFGKKPSRSHQVDQQRAELSKTGKVTRDSLGTLAIRAAVEVLEAMEEEMVEVMAAVMAVVKRVVDMGVEAADVEEPMAGLVACSVDVDTHKRQSRVHMVSRQGWHVYRRATRSSQLST